MKFKFLNLPNILDIDHRPEQVINHAYYNTLSSKTFTPKWKILTVPCTDPFLCIISISTDFVYFKYSYLTSKFLFSPCL
jgi:hypothetical protein